MFTLDPRLAADTIEVTRLPLCRVLLMDDANWPWLILVPERVGAVEIFDLSAPDRAVLIEEMARAAAILKDVTGALKINVGALGNVVRQLHVHVIARFENDPAGTAPVWGAAPRRPWKPDDAERFLEGLRTRLA
ncbi:MAG: HIT domain-containing protein [Alphaproteobacteria bacterium]|nr:HIT domain-containing protein [Alphaproteobacteria bacterium]